MELQMQKMEGNILTNQKKTRSKKNVPLEIYIIKSLSQINDKEKRYLRMKEIYTKNFEHATAKELEMLEAMHENEKRLFYGRN